MFPTEAVELRCSPGSCMHGRCVNGSCICQSGWNGNVDILTQDLTDWGGPVLSCTTHVRTMKALWSLTCTLCVAVFGYSCVGLVQQWHNFQTSPLVFWFQHPPLVFLAMTCLIFLPSSLCLSAVKLSTPDMSEIIGVTPWATIAFDVNIVSLGLVGYAHFYNVMLLPLKSFVLQDDVSFHRLIHGANIANIAGNISLWICTVYPSISVGLSPIDSRGKQVSGQSANVTLVLSVKSP
eukprot:4530823-Pleurochrysis_carterae.AAC.2